MAMYRDLSQLYSAHPIYLLLKLLVQLFTLGIFSVEGGAKAWFELILVIAALCASGYILWWEIPLLIAAVLLTTLAAGMFSVLAPQYIEAGDFEANEKIAATLRIVSEVNYRQISALSGYELEQRLKQLRKAERILKSNRKIVSELANLQSVLDNVDKASYKAAEKVQTQRQAEERKRQNEQRKKQREAEREAEREAKEERKLNERRKREGFTGGCPPDKRYEPPKLEPILICPSGYPIKVTSNLGKDDPFDGIIWKPEDSGYEGIKQILWCYESVEEAEAERGKYRFRRPKNSKGEFTP